jgi:hypothetical protein
VAVPELCLQEARGIAKPPLRRKRGTVACLARPLPDFSAKHKPLEMDPALRHKTHLAAAWRHTERGRSSGVEHNLAKVGVVSSNLIARSN